MPYVAFNFIMPDGTPMIHFINNDLWQDTLKVMRDMTSLDKFEKAFSLEACDPATRREVQNYVIGLRNLLPKIQNPTLFVSGYFLATVPHMNSNEELWKRAYAAMNMPDVFDKAQVYEAYLIAATIIFNDVSLDHQRDEPWNMN